MKLELSDFTGQPCNSRLAYEFIPKQGHDLDLAAVAGALRQNGVFVELEAPALLMLKLGGKDVSLFRSGKIIVKSTQDKGAARAIAEKLVSAME